MATIRCPLNLRMFESAHVDLLMLQWHTSANATENFCSHPADAVARRTTELEQLASWLALPAVRDVRRPLFLIAPELSFPRTLLSRVEEILRSSPRPTVFITGLEYMTVEDFDTLTAASEDMAAQPAVDGGWLDNRQGDRFVNCAAILSNCRPGGGAITHHYQAKRHPYIAEQNSLAIGRHILLFSETNTSGVEPMDFTVQICSDLVNETAVQELRQSLVEEHNHTQLDFLFLLQWNANQRAWAFAQRLDEFYTSGTGLVCGTLTAILFVNNAGPSLWRAEELGGSRLMVGESVKFRGPAVNPNTAYYEYPPGPPHSYQVLVFREDGPSFQHLEEFLPLRRINRAPGQGNEYPFRKGSCARLNQEDATLSFQEFSATCRWLADEWHLDLRRLIGLCIHEDGRPNQAIADSIRHAHEVQAALWTEIFRIWEVSARIFVQDFALAHAQSGHECPTSNRLEPMYWNEFFKRAACKQLLAGVLLQVAAESESKSFHLCGKKMRHAILDEDVSLSFHWGNTEFECDELARILRRSYGAAASSLAYQRHIYVFIEATGDPADAEAELNEDANRDVTKAEYDQLHLYDNRLAVGNVVDATPRFGVVLADKFLNRINTCRQPHDLHSLAQSALNQALDS